MNAEGCMVDGFWASGPWAGEWAHALAFNVSDLATSAPPAVTLKDVACITPISLLNGRGVLG